MDLSAAHIHLLLNHFPTIGLIIGLGLFFVGLVAKSDHLKVASLVTLVGITLITIPAYVTGSAAQAQICGDLQAKGPCTDAMLSKRLIEMHEAAAYVSLNLMVFTGGFAWLGLWIYRRSQRIPAWNVALVLLMGVVTLATVSQAANIGGEIRHPEIRVTQEAADSPLARQLGTYISTTPWTWPAFETLHMLGLTLLVGVVLLIDLKVFGFLPAIPFATLDRLLPWAILGFGLNAITGMLFFIAATYQYVGNIAFDGLVVFMLAASLNTLLFTFDRTWTRDGQSVPVHSKALAASALVLWVGVIFWGIMLPFIGQAF